MCHARRGPTKNLPGHVEPELGGKIRRSETMKCGVAKERKKNKGRKENNKTIRQRREEGGESKKGGQREARREEKGEKGKSGGKRS